MTTARELSPDAIVVSSLGAQTSLGGVLTSCAAQRAGISAATEVIHHAVVGDDGFEEPTVAHAVPTADGFRGMAKLVALALPALEDLLAQDDLRATELDRTGLWLCLPELAARVKPGGAPPSFGPKDVAAKIAAIAGLRVADANLAETAAGSAGLMHAVLEASRRVASGRLERAIVGAVDSLLEETTLEWLRSKGRLKTKDQPNGAQPGEAAAFFVLERCDVARRRDARVHAELGSAFLSVEKKPVLSGDPSTGAGLAEAVLGALGAEGDARAWIVSDHNGEGYRGNELGMTIVRLAAAAPLVANAPRWFPAQSFGDTGAASAALGVCTAARAFARDYAPSPLALVLASSDGGGRAALSLRAP